MIKYLHLIIKQHGHSICPARFDPNEYRISAENGAMLQAKNPKRHAITRNDSPCRNVDSNFDELDIALLSEGKSEEFTKPDGMHRGRHLRDSRRVKNFGNDIYNFHYTISNPYV